MDNHLNIKTTFFSVVIPCYNEEQTLMACIERVLEIQDQQLRLEIIIVDDCSTDSSYEIAKQLVAKNPEIQVLRHSKNKGKGAALKTGFQHATGEFVGIQDADLEYNPNEFRKLLAPLIAGKADVVFGSRYLNMNEYRVLYFWHTLMNKTLTFISNMFTDLDMTDMETCYKLFRRDVLEKITLQEKRFGFEPEIVAKVAALNLRIYEIGISYSARTFEEGKKIRWKDGLRALYCIFRYNAYRAPIPIQFLIYFFIGGFSAVINLILFLLIFSRTHSITISAGLAFAGAAVCNYLLCILLLFRHKAYWNSFGEIIAYSLSVIAIGIMDIFLTKTMIELGLGLAFSKATASFIVLCANFVARKYLVFPEKTRLPA